MTRSSTPLLTTLPLLLSLAACGGGGSGGGVNSSPTPPTTSSTPGTPAPTPAPAPVVNYDDSEYRRSNAATSASALAAYGAGATGTGVKIAILDSGLTDVKGEFTGRIDSASRDMVASRGISDQDGHGTSVAAVAAAARNGSDILGVAFNATVMVLRTDEVGSCTGSDGCSHFDTTLAAGVDHARVNGAKVVNLSLGGEAMNAGLRAAISRATAAGMVIVISAGNSADANPDPFAQVASTSAAAGQVIIAGGLDASNGIASFSNRAGTFAQYYLATLAVGVRTFDQNGTSVLGSGTSYAAPGISGAVALLAQAFPNLSGAQIVDLLLRTADDLGAAGTDAIFGRGKLNLTQAFQPQGATALAGSTTAVALSSDAMLSQAMGDAAASAQAVILDGYNRAYRIDLASGLRREGQHALLGGTLERTIRRNSLNAGAATIAVSLASNPLYPHPWAMGGSVDIALSPQTQLRASFGEPAEQRTGVAATMLAARAPAETAGIATDDRIGFALAHRIGNTRFETSVEQGRLASRRRGEPQRDYSRITLAAEQAFGPLGVRAGAGLLREDSTVLGARLGGVLGGAGARTGFADLDLSLALADGWALRGQWRQGWTRAVRSGALESGTLTSNAFAIDLSRISARERIALRIAQPLRVSTSRWRLRLPTDYAFETGTAQLADTMLDLAPAGREIDIEGGYGRTLGAGWLDANLYMRRNPGNMAAAPADIGMAVRYSLGF